MNFAFLLSGAVSSNPNYLILQFVLVAIGGAYAGYLGIDYYFRPVYRNFLARFLPGEGNAATHNA